MAEGDFYIKFGSNAATFADQIDAAALKVEQRFNTLRESLKVQATQINDILRTVGNGGEFELPGLSVEDALRLSRGIESAVARGMQAGISNALKSLRLSNAIDVPVRLVDESGRTLSSSSRSRVVSAAPAVDEESRGRGRPASLGVTQDQIASIREARAAMVEFTSYLRKTREATGQASTGLERFVAHLNAVREGTSGFTLPTAGVPGASSSLASAASAQALAQVLGPAMQQLAERAAAGATTGAARATPARAVTTELPDVSKFVKTLEGGIGQVLDRFVETRVEQLVNKQLAVNPNVDRGVVAQGAASRATMEAELFRAMLEPHKFFAPPAEGGYGITQGRQIGDLTKNLDNLIYEAGRRIINAQLPHDGRELTSDESAMLERRLGFARLSEGQKTTIRSQGEYDPFNAAGQGSGEVVRELLQIAQAAGILRDDVGSLDGLMSSLTAVVREHAEAEAASTGAAQANAEAQAEAAGAANATAEAFGRAATGALDLVDVLKVAARSLQEQGAAAQVAEERRLHGGSVGERQEEFYQRSNALQSQFRRQATELIPGEQRGALFSQLGLPQNFVFPDVKQIGPILEALNVPDLATKQRQLEHFSTQIDAIQTHTESAIRRIAEPNPHLTGLLEQAFTGQRAIFGGVDIEGTPDAKALQVERDERALRSLQSAGVRVALPDLVDRLLPNGRLPGVIDPSATQIATQGSSIPATKGRGSGFVDQRLGAAFFPEFYDRLQSALQAQEAGGDLTPAQRDDIRNFQEAKSAVGRIYDRIQEFKKTYTPVVQELIKQPGFALGSIPSGTPLRALAEGLMANFATGQQIYSDDQLSRHIVETAAQHPEITGIDEGNRLSRVAALYGRNDLFDAAAGRTGDISQMAPEEAAAYIQAAGLDVQRTEAREGSGFSRSSIRGSIGELLQSMGISLRTANFNRIPEVKELPGLERGVPGTRDKIQEFNRALRDMTVNLERLLRVAPEEVPGAFEKQYGNLGDIYTRLTGRDIGSLDDGLVAGQRALARTRTAASRASGARILYTPEDIVGGRKSKQQQVQEALDKAERSRQEQEERQADLARRAVHSETLLEDLSVGNLLNIPAATLLEPVQRAPLPGSGPDRPGAQALPAGPNFGIGEAAEPSRLDTTAIAKYLDRARTSLEHVAGPEAVGNVDELSRLIRQEPRFANIFSAGALSNPLETLTHAGRLQSALGALRPGEAQLAGTKYISSGDADLLYSQIDRGEVTPIEPGTTVPTPSGKRAATKQEELAYKVLNGDMQVIEEDVANRLRELDAALRAAGVSQGAENVRAGSIQTILDEIIQNAVASVELVLKRLAAELSGSGISQLGTAADRVGRKAGRTFDLSVGFEGFDENGRPRLNTGDFDPYLRAAGAADVRGVRAATAEDVGARGLSPTPARGDVIGGLSAETRAKFGLGSVGFPTPPATQEATEGLQAATVQAATALRDEAAVLHEQIAATEEDVSATRRKVTATEEAAAGQSQLAAQAKRAGTVEGRTRAATGAKLLPYLQEEFPDLHEALSRGDLPAAAQHLKTAGLGATALKQMIKPAYALSPEETGDLAFELIKIQQATTEAQRAFESFGRQANLTLAGASERARELAAQARKIAESGHLASPEASRALAPIYSEFVGLPEFASKEGQSIGSGVFGHTLGLNNLEFNEFKKGFGLDVGGAGAGGGGGGIGGLLSGAGGGEPPETGPGGVLGRLLFGRNGNGSILERQLLSVGRTFTRFSSDMLVFAGFAKFQEIATTALSLEKEFTRMGAALEAVDGSAAGLSDLRGNLAGIATSLGAPLDDVVKTASEFVGVFSKVHDIEFATKITEQLKLISLGALSTEEAFRGISSIISGYQANGTFAQGLNIQNLDQIGNQVAEASSITGTNVADIIQGAGRLAPEAAALNIAPAQLIALQADVAKRSGQSGEASGEQLSRLFSTFQTSKVQGLFQKYGIATEEQLSQGKYGEVLTSLLQKFPDLTKAQQASLREAIGSGRQAAVANALLGDSRGVLKDYNKVAEDSPGALDRRTSAILRTFAQQIKIFEQNIQSLANLIVRSGVLDGLGLLFVALNKVFSMFITVGNALNSFAEKVPGGEFLRDTLAGLVGLRLTGSLLSHTFGRLPELVNAAAGTRVASNIGGALTYLTGGRGGGAVAGVGRIRSAFFPQAVAAGGTLAFGSLARFNPVAGARATAGVALEGVGAVVGGLANSRLATGISGLFDRLGASITRVAPAVARLGEVLIQSLGSAVLSGAIASLEKVKTLFSDVAKLSAIDAAINALRRLKATIEALTIADVASSVLGGVGGIGQLLKRLGGRVTGRGIAAAADTAAIDTVAAGSAARSAKVAEAGLGAESAEVKAAKVARGAVIGEEVTAAEVAAPAAAPFLLTPPGLAVLGAGALAYGAHKFDSQQRAIQKRLDNSIDQIFSGELTPQQQNELASKNFTIAQKQEQANTFFGSNSLAAQAHAIVNQDFFPTHILTHPVQTAQDYVSAANNLINPFDFHPGQAVKTLFHPGDDAVPDNQNVIFGKYDSATKALKDAAIPDGIRNRAAAAQDRIKEIDKELAPLNDKKTFTDLVNAAGKNKQARAANVQSLTFIKTTLQGEHDYLQSLIDGYDGVVFSVQAATSTNSVVGMLKNLGRRSLGNKTTQQGIQAIIDNSLVPAGAEKFLDVLRDPNATLAQRNNAEIAIKQREVASLSHKLKDLSSEDQATAMSTIAQDLADIDQLTKATLDNALQAATTLAGIYDNRQNFAAETGALGNAIAAVRAKMANDAGDPAALAADRANLDQLQTQRALAARGGILAGDAAAEAGATGSAARDAAHLKTLQDTRDALLAPVTKPVTKLVHYHDGTSATIVTGTTTGPAGGRGSAKQVAQTNNEILSAQNQQKQDAIAAQAAAGAVTVAQLQLAGNSAGAQAQLVANAQQAYGAAVSQYGAGTTEANSAYAAYLQAQTQYNDFLTQTMLSKGAILVAQLNLAGDKAGAAAQQARNAADAYAAAVRQYGAGSQQANDALAASINAEASSRDALIASLKTRLDVRLSQLALHGGANASGSEADARLREAQKELATFLSHGGKTGTDDYRTLVAQVNNARRAAVDAHLQDQLDALDFQKQMGRISAGQEINALRNILKQRNLTVQERRSILLKIKDLADQADGQWNFGDIDVPTPYESRRLQKVGVNPNRYVSSPTSVGAASAKATAASVTQHYNTTNHVSISGADMHAVKAYIKSILGPEAIQRSTSYNRKT